jgi:hypothetical protein
LRLGESFLLGGSLAPAGPAIGTAVADLDGPAGPGLVSPHGDVAAGQAAVTADLDHTRRIMLAPADEFVD